MILLKGKWLFVSTMKCATNTLYKALQEQVEGAEWFSEGKSQFHGLPTKRRAPIHWTTCRNPYDRAVSIWHSTCVRESNRHRYQAAPHIVDMGGDPLCFADFVEHILLARPQLHNKYLWLNQSCWQDRFLHDLVLPVESLTSSIEEELGIKLDLPYENVSEGREVWQEYYKDEGLRRIVRWWAGDDFKRYGYDT